MVTIRLTITDLPVLATFMRFVSPLTALITKNNRGLVRGTSTHAHIHHPRGIFHVIQSERETNIEASRFHHLAECPDLVLSLRSLPAPC